MLRNIYTALRLALRHRDILILSYPRLIYLHSTRVSHTPVFLLHKIPSKAFQSRQDYDHSHSSSTDSESHLRKELTIGANISNFTDRINLKLPIVDKTGYLYKLITKRTAVFVMSPRRFGKTLNLTTVFAIFTIGKEWWDRNCQDLAIVREFKYDFPQHPVLQDLSGTNTALELKDLIVMHLKKIIDDNDLRGKLDYEIGRYEKTLEDSAFLVLFQMTIMKVAEKNNKGMVILIDEYDRPITSIAERILNKSLDTQDLISDHQIHELIDLLKKFFERLKSLRVLHFSGGTYVRFEYLTGIVPLSQLGLFSGPNGVFNTKIEKEFYYLVGYTQNEIHTVFSNNIKSMALRVYRCIKIDQTESLTDEQEKNHIKEIEDSIYDSIHKNYNGFRFNHDQEHILYSPFVINSLLEVWKEEKVMVYPAFYAASGSSSLIWRAVRMTPLEQKCKFLWALLDKENAEPLYRCPRNDLSVDQTLDNLFGNPERLLFFSGVLTVQKKGSIENLWSLGLVNNEMRTALLADIDNETKISQNADNILEQLSCENYGEYFDLINNNLKRMSVFMNEFSPIKKNKHKIEAYGHILFAVIHDLLLYQNEINKEQKIFSIEDFGYVKDKITTADSQKIPDFIVFFKSKKVKDENTDTDYATQKRVALIIEFKCKDSLVQSLKEAKSDLERKNLEIRTRLNKKYSFINLGCYCTEIWATTRCYPV